MKSEKLSDIFKSTLSFVLIMALLITVVLPPLSVNATSGSWTGGQVNRGYRLMVEYTETEQNPQTNTSRVTATLYLVQDRTYSLYIGTRTATITINGVTITISNIPAIRNDGNVTTELGSASTVVTHDADGKKTITIEATFDMNATLSGTYYGTMSTSETVELDNIDQSGPSVSLKFNSATTSSVNLTASANVTCDTWQYSLNGGSTWVTFGSSGTSNTFTISNLNGGTSYSVIVRARKASNQVYASSGTVSATTIPAAPGGLSMGAISQNYAILKWNAVTGANSYNLYLDDVLYATGVTGTAYQFTGLAPNTDYTFGISATGAGGTSTITSTGHYVTLPNTPTGLTVTSRNDRSVNLSWSYDKGGNAATTTFNIYRDGVLIGSSSSTSFTDTTYGNSDCVYTVAAITSAGASTQSASVSVAHIPLAITLQATNNGGYITVTPSFVGGLDRTVDSNSLKWAYGTHDAAYFVNNGYSFTNSFAVLRNGTYTVYAEDMDSDVAVQTIVISGIYIKNTEGAYTQTFTDLAVDAAGIPISFERTYNSMLQTDGVFGRGWSFNYAKETHLSEDGAVRLVYLPDGTIQYFSVEDDGYAGINTQSKLTADGSKLILTTKERLIYTYENGYMTQIEDANGNTVSIELDTDNNPVKITDSVGRIYTIAYNDGKIASITDPAGRIFTYIYDANGDLVAQKQASGSIANKFVYSNGSLTKITDAFDNPITEVQYNNQNQVISVVESGDYTTYYLYKITTKGEIVIYESDSEIVLDEMDSTTHPASNTYDAFGQLVVDADGLLYEYNEDGTICKIDGVNTDKTLIVYTYDEYGNVIHIITTDKNDLVIEEVIYTYVYFTDTEYIASVTEVVTTFTYDKFGEVTKTETRDTLLSSDRAGNILSERTIYDEVDESVSYKYTSSGLLQTESTDETITKYTYDSYGHITKIMVIEEDVVKTTTFCYNIIGQVISQTQDGLTSSNIYDLSGNVIKVTQTDGVITRISRVVYNSNDQVIQKISDAQYRASEDGLTADSNGIGITNIYNNSNVGERYTYDSNGNVATYINSANNITVNTYDSGNRLVKTVTYETVDQTSTGLTTRYVYSEDGNLILTVYPHQYNAANDNLNIANDINEYTDQTVGERITYDENGNVVKYIDSFGKETVNTYDSQNHLVKSVTDGEVTRFVYNGGDDLLQVIYPDQYDATKDLLDLEAEEPIDKYADSDVGDRYEYDEDGNILSYTNRFGDKTTNTYDADGNLTATERSDGSVFTYDDEGRTEKETYANGLTQSYQYDTHQTVITGSNGITVTYDTNAFGEVSGYQFKAGTSSRNYAYTYDSNGNILTISLNGSLQQTFTYNDSNELVRVDDAAVGQTTTFAYDFVGNITSVKTYAYTTGTLGAVLSTQEYSYNSQNQRTDLSYDANGNLLALGGYQFTWSDRRLAGASGAHSIAYTYDYNGIRTGKTIDGSTISYTVDENNNVIAQTDGTNTLQFVYDSNSAPVYMEYDGTVYYYEKNLQGDIVAILDTGGATVVQYSYDIWGKLLGITGDLADTVGTANPLRYRSYYYDTETELYYLQSRYYSPELMRFISMDDAALSNAQGEPIGSNLYAYCLNNPVYNSDESGCGPFLAIGLQFVITVGRLTFGLEALWSTLNWRFYMFAFVGGSRSFNVSSIKEIEGALMQDLLLLRRSVKGFSLSSFGRFKKYGISVSFIAVLGNRYATFPSDYCGWFTGISLSFLNVTVSGAYGYSGSAKIGSIGVGATTSKADANWGQTFYIQLTGNNAFKNSWNGFLSGIKNRLERFKMFACFFY